jgi:ribonucleotide monophosphatase NagD (HAD superfamily)
VTVGGLLLDIDGVLTVSWRPLPGAADAVAELIRRGVPFRLVTGVLVRTGKFCAADLERGSSAPDQVIDDVSALPALIDELG